MPDPRTDDHNTSAALRLVADAASAYAGRALRPAIANWWTRETDVDTFVDVVRELGRSLVADAAAGAAPASAAAS